MRPGHPFNETRLNRWREDVLWQRMTVEAARQCERQEGVESPGAYVC